MRFCPSIANYHKTPMCPSAMPRFRIGSKLGLIDSTCGKDSLCQSVLRLHKGEPRWVVMTMLHVARDSGMFNPAWLQACKQTLVWQSAGASLYRLSQDDGEWDALFLPVPANRCERLRPTRVCVATRMPITGSTPLSRLSKKTSIAFLCLTPRASFSNCFCLHPPRWMIFYYWRFPWFVRWRPPMPMVRRWALCIPSTLLLIAMPA